jgi:hypothetical protein
MNLTTAAQVHARFYKDLGEVLTKWQGGGWQTLVAGDFNARVKRGLRTEDRLEDEALTKWVKQHNLSIVEFEEGVHAPTYSTSQGQGRPEANSQLDAILISQGLAKSAREKVETIAVPGQVWGHKALSWSSDSGLCDWLGLR